MMQRISEIGSHTDVQPFLRIGDGWSTRQDAARSGRRYVPRGGHIVDFSSAPIGRGARKSPTRVDINVGSTNDSSVKSNTVHVEISESHGKYRDPNPHLGLRRSIPTAKGASTRVIPPAFTKKKVCHTCNHAL